MTIVSRSPKTWPYAQNSAQDSLGKLLGTLHPGLLGDILCWEAKGEARRLFESNLKKTILDYLREHSDKAQESGSYLSIPLFMIGKRAKRAKPVVMFVSDDKVARKEAYDLIIKSDIMTKYPGFELGHSDFEKLMAWAGETVFAFAAQREDASDCCQLISRSSSEQPVRTATAGGIISYRGKHMLLSVNHFLKDSPPIELPAHKAEANQISECEITGLGDFDDDDDDDSDTDFVETVRQGSISDVDEGKESEIDDSETPTSASESEANSQRRPSTSPQEFSLPKGRLLGQSNPVLCKEEFDYALFEVDRIYPSASLLNNAISLTDLDKIESGPRNTAVKTATLNGGTVHGVMSEDTLTVRLPQSKDFVEVYTARFFGSLGPGDCGSWVRDEATGRLFGHVFAGNLSNGLTAIMPAKLVFEHARALLDQELPLVASLEFEQGLKRLKRPATYMINDDDDDDHDSTYGSAQRRPRLIPETVPRTLFKPKLHDSVGQVTFIKKYVCRDPAAAGLHSKIKIEYPLTGCKDCSSGKIYETIHDAATHFRWVHLTNNQLPDDKRPFSRKWPPMAELGDWFEELLVMTSEAPGSSSAGETAPEKDSLSTDEALPGSNFDLSERPSQPLTAPPLSHPSIESVGAIAPPSQPWAIPLPGFSFSPNSMSTATPSSSSTSPYQLYNVSSHAPSSQLWDDEFLKGTELSTFIDPTSDSAFSSLEQLYNTESLAQQRQSHAITFSVPSSVYLPEMSFGVDAESFAMQDFSSLISPLATSPPIQIASSAMEVDKDSPPTAAIVKPRQAITSRSSGRSNSDQRLKASKIFCTVCNDFPNGFRGLHELNRHMLRHGDQKILKRFICRDPASVGIKSDIQAINPLSKCQACLSKKQYDTRNRAIAHLWVTHIRDATTGKTHTGDSGRPLTEKLKDWCCEVQVDKYGIILPEAGGTSADTGGGSSGMDCDDDNDDTTIDSYISGTSDSTQAIDESSTLYQVTCSNCSTKGGLFWEISTGKSVCLACGYPPTSQDTAQPSHPHTVDLSLTPVRTQNPQASSMRDGGQAIREPFSTAIEAGENSRLLSLVQSRVQHVSDGGPPAAKPVTNDPGVALLAQKASGDPEATADSRGSVGITDISDANNGVQRDLWGPSIQSFDAGLASPGQKVLTTNRISSTNDVHLDDMCESVMESKENNEEKNKEKKIEPIGSANTHT